MAGWADKNKLLKTGQGHRLQIEKRREYRHKELESPSVAMAPPSCGQPDNQAVRQASDWLESLKTCVNKCPF